MITENHVLFWSLLCGVFIVLMFLIKVSVAIPAFIFIMFLGRCFWMIIDAIQRLNR